MMPSQKKLLYLKFQIIPFADCGPKLQKIVLDLSMVSKLAIETSKTTSYHQTPSINTKYQIMNKGHLTNL